MCKGSIKIYILTVRHVIIKITGLEFYYLNFPQKIQVLIESCISSSTLRNGSSGVSARALVIRPDNQKKKSKLRNLKSFHLEIWCLKDNVDNFYKNVRLTVAYKYLCGKQQSLNLIKQLVNDLQLLPRLVFHIRT